MPTNRTRIKRAVRSRVTDEARAIYAEALRTCIGIAFAALRAAPRQCLKYIDPNRELGVSVGEQEENCSSPTRSNQQ